MKFWLLASNNIYKNWMNFHIDRIMFTVSKLEIKSQNSGGTPCTKAVIFKLPAFLTYLLIAFELITVEIIY